MYSQVPKRIERINYALTALLGVIGLVFLAKPYALGLFVGAVIASLHFSGLRWIVDRVRTAPGQKRLVFGMLLVPHLLVTMAAVVAAMALLPLSPGALLIGFSIFLVSIIAGTLQVHLSPQQERSSS